MTAAFYIGTVVLSFLGVLGGIGMLIATVPIGLTRNLAFGNLVGQLVLWSLVSLAWMKFEKGPVPILVLGVCFVTPCIQLWEDSKVRRGLAISPVGPLNPGARAGLYAAQVAIVIAALFHMIKAESIRWY